MRPIAVQAVALVALLFAIPLSPSVADDPDLNANQTLMPIKKFMKEFQLLARRNPAGQTKLEQQVTLEKLRAEIHEVYDDLNVEYQAKIIAVDWKDGLATIKSESPIPEYKPSARMPFKIAMTNQPIQIPMTRENALETERSKQLTVRGKMKFLDGKWGLVARPPKSQSLLWIRNDQYKGTQSIGTFITENYTIEIDGEEVFTNQ